MIINIQLESSLKKFLNQLSFGVLLFLGTNTHQVYSILNTNLCMMRDAVKRNYNKLNEIKHNLTDFTGFDS